MTSGFTGQLKLQNSAVVVVGVGGLGCPALQYLAAAGIGKLGVVDHDVVEMSNLQRQILHTESRVNMPKALSAEIALKELNSNITVISHATQLTSSNARKILSDYDIVLDCTDNVPTRYLLSDTAVRLNKPLVSGAAMKFDGQLCIYNLGSDGPCYRCLYPKPPALITVKTCQETGILGSVTGIIGVLQAVECIKLLLGLHDKKPTLLIFSAISFPPFRSAKLRSKRLDCPACGHGTQSTIQIEETDYVAFCGGPAFDYERLGLEEGPPGHRIQGKEMKRMMENDKTLVIDVRPSIEYGICHISPSINVPFHEFVSNPAEHLPEDEQRKILLVCRLGNDSQIAADALRSVAPSRFIQDLVGGLRSWSQDVDSSFPIY